MPTCPRCGKENAGENLACIGCGCVLVSAPGESFATVRWKGQISEERGLHRALPLDTIFAGKNKAVLGRSADCDLCLAHPTVSRQHALLERNPEGIRLFDLGSVNGVLVDGKRIAQSVLLTEDQRVGIGPFLFRLAGTALHILDSSQSLRLKARRLDRVVGRGSSERKILDDISLVIDPSEFVCLLGPSGSGKSTLMDCLSGRRPPSHGVVMANGENFFLHFDSFRQSLGYVPQRDIVHTQLSVERALHYTARLRLPPDTRPEELTNRIREVLQRMELGPHKDTMIGNLSGGQIKRVSLGAELLARPCLLFIDEATSGLDAGTETRMMHLFRQLADEGRSIVCITHHVDNVDLCHLIVVLARGKLVYFGPPAEARAYFHVSRLSEIYDTLAAKDPAAWEKEYCQSSLHQHFVSDRLALQDKLSAMTPTHLGKVKKEDSGASSVVLAPTPAKVRRPMLHQFFVLTGRYLELIWRDYRGLRLLLLQAPIVAAFILLGFAHKPYDEKILAPRVMTAPERAAFQVLGKIVEAGIQNNQAELEALDPEGKSRRAYEFLKDLAHVQGPVVPYQFIVNPRFTYMLVFLTVLIVIWFGCNNASKEIVKEQAIFGRERDVNLGIPPYLASKFLVLGLITALQTLVLLAAIYGTLEFLHAQFGDPLPHHAYRLDYLPQFGVLAVLALSGVAVGLLLSACVSSPDQANVLLPYVLIPQIILGGGILTIDKGPLLWLAQTLSPAYWAYRACQRGVTTLPPDLPWHMNYNDSVLLACAAMLGQTIVLVGLTAYFLKLKDIRKS